MPASHWNLPDGQFTLLGHCGLWGWPERVAGVAQVAVGGSSDGVNVSFHVLRMRAPASDQPHVFRRLQRQVSEYSGRMTRQATECSSAFADFQLEWMERPIIGKRPALPP